MTITEIRDEALALEHGPREVFVGIEPRDWEGASRKIFSLVQGAQNPRSHTIRFTAAGRDQILKVAEVAGIRAIEAIPKHDSARIVELNRLHITGMEPLLPKRIRTKETQSSQEPK